MKTPEGCPWGQAPMGKWLWIQGEGAARGSYTVPTPQVQPPSATTMGKSLRFPAFCIPIHQMGARIPLLPFPSLRQGLGLPLLKPTAGSSRMGVCNKVPMASDMGAPCSYPLQTPLPTPWVMDTLTGRREVSAEQGR